MMTSGMRIADHSCEGAKAAHGDHGSYRRKKMDIFLLPDLRPRLTGFSGTRSDAASPQRGSYRCSLHEDLCRGKVRDNHRHLSHHLIGFVELLHTATIWRVSLPISTISFNSLFDFGTGSADWTFPVRISSFWNSSK